MPWESKPENRWTCTRTFTISKKLWKTRKNNVFRCFENIFGNSSWFAYLLIGKHAYLDEKYVFMHKTAYDSVINNFSKRKFDFKKIKTVRNFIIFCLEESIQHNKKNKIKNRK